MAKRCMVLVLSMLVLSTSLFSMTEEDKRAIRKELYENHANGQINVATLSETGLSLSEVIDRDIQILSEHKVVLQKNIDFCKGNYVRNFVPFMKGVGVVSTGGFCAATGLFAAFGFEWCKKIYYGGDAQDKWQNWIVDKAADWELISYKEYCRELAQRFDLKVKENPGFLAISLAVPVAAAASVISGVVCMSCIYNACKYEGSINALLIKFRKQMKRDQAIIAQLKEIKHILAI